MFDNFKSALLSIWSNKLRSLLTLLGVVIGVSSVVILIALGQGLKSDVSGLIQGFGTNVVTIVGGKIDTKGGAGANPADFISGNVLTMQDRDSIAKVTSVDQVAVASLASGVVKYKGLQANPTLLGATPNILQAFNLLTVGSGSMFASTSGKEIVLGYSSKATLFGDEDAIGKTVTISDVPYTVVAVLNKPKGGSALGGEFDAISYIPFDEATVMNKNEVKIYRIFAKVSDSVTDIKPVKDAITSAILSNHKGVDNFSVLTQDDILGLFSQFLTLTTAMVSGIAAISLLVGGIGIMNIMLVTVTERTREIGLRKALGATQGAILLQFLVEAVVVTLVGGMIGLGIAFAAGKAISHYSPLHPAFSLQVILVTVGISVLIGVVFGIWPAWRASVKDPIEALRYE